MYKKYIGLCNLTNIRYVITFFISIYILLCIYIRVNMQFWYSQPVFHIYNIKYWINPPGVINKNPPPVNKFVNLINNKLIEVVSDTDISHTIDPTGVLIKRICDFIKTNYVRGNNDTEYKPSTEDIIAYLSKNAYSSFFNIYTEKMMLFQKGDLIVPEHDDICGVVSGRILNLNINANKQVTSFPLYYIDNLCIKPTHRKMGLASQIIQTFYYNISRKNPHVNAYIFKREGAMTAIVPLVFYYTHCFDIISIIAENDKPKMINLFKADAKNFHILIDSINANKKKYKCTILPDVSNLLHLITTGKIVMYAIIDAGVVIALYVFRMINLRFNGNNVVECIAVISGVEDSILVSGFMDCLIDIHKKNNIAFILIEDTSDCGILIKLLQSNSSVRCIFKSRTAFFLYNYVSYSFINTKTLLIY